ncbi:MAG: glycoside hydrolase family 75 protein [Akkermansiaceae bacterium]
MTEPPETSPKPSSSKTFPWLRVSFFLLVCGFLFVALRPELERLIRAYNASRYVEKPVFIEPDNSEVEEPLKITVPSEHTATSGGDIRKMSKGFRLETKVTLGNGRAASEERLTDDSYVASYELKINLPEPVVDLVGLKQSNENIDKVLPGLAEMLPTAQVSTYFHKLYAKKVERLKSKSTMLNELLTRHNLYDCETILNLKHPSTGRKALLVQAEMDVVSDGSDGDRLPEMPDSIVNSSYYQPMTSYGWKKTGKVENPLIAGWKNRISKAKAEIDQAATKPDRKSWLKERIKKIEREIQDMESRSFLIADYDPFIVMPVDMVLTRDDSYTARVGDYAVVIYRDKIYPAIVGDAGPSYKIGEASLRMCKELNPKASSYSRPVSDLTITYIVFPRSADSFQAPDYSLWHKRCLELLGEIGGLGQSVTLHQWEDTFPKPSLVAPVEVSQDDE